MKVYECYADISVLFKEFPASSAVLSYQNLCSGIFKNMCENFMHENIVVNNEDFFTAHGRPDVIITDPPRAGMHPKVIEQIIHALPNRIVYVSCNPATQARDISLLDEKYSVEKVQPVDMFPHTHHVENVALLKLRQ